MIPKVKGPPFPLFLLFLIILLPLLWARLERHMNKGSLMLVYSIIHSLSLPTSFTHSLAHSLTHTDTHTHTCWTQTHSFTRRSYLWGWLLLFGGGRSSHPAQRRRTPNPTHSSTHLALASGG
jgi:hypothetical protein